MSGATCSLCGRVADTEAEGDPPLGWSSDHTDASGRAEPDVRRRVCPQCTRRYVRSIEAKLDQEWW